MRRTCQTRGEGKVALRRAKDAMIDMRLGYESQTISYLLVDWKNRHPEAYKAFRKSWEDEPLGL